MSFKILPIAHFGRPYWASALLATLPHEGAKPLPFIFKEEINSAADQLWKASSESKTQHTVHVVHDQDGYYIELFKRQMYALWGVTTTPFNEKGSAIPFHWHSDNPRLINSHSAVCHFLEAKFPKAWDRGLGTMAYQAGGSDHMMGLLSELQRRKRHTDRSVIIGEKRIPYHGFLLDAKSSFLHTQESEKLLKTSTIAAQIVVDFLYHRVNHIDPSWSPLLLREIQEVADHLHLAFLSQIAGDALKRF